MKKENIFLVSIKAAVLGDLMIRSRDNPIFKRYLLDQESMRTLRMNFHHKENMSYLECKTLWFETLVHLADSH